MDKLVDMLKSIIDVLGVILGLIAIGGTILTFARRNSALLRKLRGPFVALLVLSLVLGSILVVRRLQPPPPRFPDAASDQSITVSIAAGIQDIPTLDPAQVSDTISYEVTSLIFPNLLILDKSLHLKAWAAESYERSGDGKKYTFHLRPGMKWSDGSPIDAHSFAYAINRTLSPCTKAPNARYLFALRDAKAFNSQTCKNNIITAAPGQTTIPSLLNDPLGDSIVVPDDLTLELNLPQAAPYFLYALTYSCAAAVPAAAAHPDWTNHLTDNGGFSGNLFRLVQHGGGKATLQRNEAFWGAKPELQKLTFDLSSDGTGDDVACPDATKCTSVPNLSISYVGMNWSKPPFDDLRMRQAFALALDKTQFYLPQFGMATNHIVPDGMPDYRNPTLTGPDATNGLSGNLAKARDLAHAYAAARCNGNPGRCPAVTFVYPDSAPNNSLRAAQMWQSAFPGMSISAVKVSEDVFNDPNYVHEQQIWLSGWAADYPDPQDFLSLQFLPDGFYGTSSTTGAQDAMSLLSQADVELDGPTRVLEYQQAEQILVTQVAWIPLFQVHTPVGFHSYVANYAITASGLPSVETWQQVYITNH